MIVNIEVLPNNRRRLTFVPCPQCHEKHTLDVNYDELMDYYATGYVSVFKNLLDPQKELFLTGIGPECWKKIFSGGEY